MRAIVRGDFDGIVSATLLLHIKQVNDVLIVDLKEYLDGKIEITDQDILCNLPFHPSCYQWFDHHSSEARRSTQIPDNFNGAYSLAPSAARVIYDYFLPFKPMLESKKFLVVAADKVDSADLSKSEILKPEGFVMLGFLLDPRSRMASEPAQVERYNRWIANLPRQLLAESLEMIIADSETNYWSGIYTKNQLAAVQLFRDTTKLEGNVIFSDFRGRTVRPANRFIIYSLPEFAAGNISVQISDGEVDVWYEISVGHSIFNRTSMTDVGDLCGWYGGGGHKAVGVCRPSSDDVEQVLMEILHSCKEPLTELP